MCSTSDTTYDFIEPPILLPGLSPWEYELAWWEGEECADDVAPLCWWSSCCMPEPYLACPCTCDAVVVVPAAFPWWGGGGSGAPVSADLSLSCWTAVCCATSCCWSCKTPDEIPSWSTCAAWWRGGRIGAGVAMCVRRSWPSAVVSSMAADVAVALAVVGLGTCGYWTADMLPEVLSVDVVMV